MADASVAAIEFALDPETECPMDFLQCWFHGDFDVIRREWPEAPEAVFIGADPLHPMTKLTHNAELRPPSPLLAKVAP